MVYASVADARRRRRNERSHRRGKILPNGSRRPRAAYARNGSRMTSEMPRVTRPPHGHASNAIPQSGDGDFHQVSSYFVATNLGGAFMRSVCLISCALGVAALLLMDAPSPASASTISIGPVCGTCQGSIYTLDDGGAPTSSTATDETWRITYTINTSGYNGTGTRLDTAALKVSSTLTRTSLVSAPGGVGRGRPRVLARDARSAKPAGWGRLGQRLRLRPAHRDRQRADRAGRHAHLRVRPGHPQRRRRQFHDLLGSHRIDREGALHRRG